MRDLRLPILIATIGVIITLGGLAHQDIPMPSTYSYDEDNTENVTYGIDPSNQEQLDYFVQDEFERRLAEMDESDEETEDVSPTRSKPRTATIATFYRDSLPSEMLADYDAIYEGLMSHADDISITSKDEDAINRIFTSVMCDHPEVFWVNDSTDGETWYWYTTYDDGTPTSLKPVYTYTADEVETMRPEIDGVTSAFMSTIDDSMGDYEVTRKAYEYLADNITYTDGARNKRNVYGGLVDRQGVCSSYAKSMSYLLGKAGVWCTIIDGQANGPHEWCLVRISGRYCHVDPTWGDSQYNDSKGDLRLAYNYSYLCVSTEQLLSEGRTIDDDVLPSASLPETTNEYDWYVLRNAVVDSPSSSIPREQYEKAVSDGSGIVFLRYSTQEAFDDAISRLPSDYFDVKNEENGDVTTLRYQYSYDDVAKTVCIMLDMS